MFQFTEPFTHPFTESTCTHSLGEWKGREGNGMEEKARVETDHQSSGCVSASARGRDGLVSAPRIEVWS